MGTSAVYCTPLSDNLAPMTLLQLVGKHWRYFRMFAVTNEAAVDILVTFPGFVGYQTLQL